MRALAIAVACLLLALLTGVAAYEWRSPPEPTRVEPVELLPAPEPIPPREPPKRQRAGKPVQPDPASGGGAGPVAPAPPSGGGDDDGADDDADDDGDDGGGDD